MKRAFLNIVISIAVFALLVTIVACMTGCSRPVSRSLTKETHSVNIDSVLIANAERVARSDSFVSEKEIRDTTIGIAGNSVSLAFLGNDTTVKSGNVSLHIYTDDKGQKRAICKADSLTLVINNLTRERTAITRSLDSLVTKWQTEMHTSAVDTRSLEQVVLAERNGFWGNIKGFLQWMGVFMIGAILGLIGGIVLATEKKIKNVGI